MYNVIEVEFCNGDSDYKKAYAYYTAEELAVGDICVVPVRDKEYYTVRVKKVRGLSRASRDRASRWIVCKIDTKSYEEDCKKYDLILEIKNKLRERKEGAEEMLIYQQLAKTDPEIAGLLEELKTVAPNMVPKLEEK